ncbi:hypothetical protein GCM10027277_34280 [Pseudoduganella ginsengisoli]|uniref:Porin n=1 Tax=Pseudoduganella ginsengisoli TaxID=1462440 RepID=A0A6L6Q7D9_9BURK|nr:hypothetical protein [Pseudoduganella ginsengisoli]MTW05560.1 hypothetical protein [Pseudoduganella ginsengisoli]
MKSLIPCALLVLSQAALADDSTALYLRAQTESVETALGSATHSFGMGELRWQRDMLRGVFTARHDTRDGDLLRVNELSLERPLGGGFATVGKKVMSWDVGYAFRPLDVVQQEDRRALNPVTLEGVPMVAWEAFDDSRAITVVWTNPGHGKRDQPKGDGALAVRLYRQQGSTDQYAVLRASQRNGVEGGVSFSHVASDEMEVHGSVLLQQRHDEWVISRTAPPRWQRFDGGGKALAGFTWTTESKFAVLGEAWVDRTAARGRQRNALLRAAQTSGDLEVAADVLWQVRQGANGGSRIASVGAAWNASPWLVSASLRHYSGAASYVARNVMVANVQYAF